MNTCFRLCFAVACVCLSVCAHGADAPAWQHPLYLGGDGYWRQRIPVTIANGLNHAVDGASVALPIGSGPGELPLAGVPAQQLRTCTAAGVETLYSLLGPNGLPLAEGPIPPGSTLLLPATAEAQQSQQLYVYFDNPAAGVVPDFLPGRPLLVNGDVEHGPGDVPDGWQFDRADDQHQVAWSAEQPQSGRRCLKTTVAAGAEPTWIAARQAGIQVGGGSRYRLKAWVKAADVKGSCGWYVHLGNQRQPQLSSPMLRAGDGSFDWRAVEATFDVPADADRLSLGTVLRGTGTAWFDHVTLECLDAGKLRATAGGKETRDLKPLDVAPGWPDDAPQRRAIVRLFNFTDQPQPPALVFVDAAVLNNRLCNHLNRESVVVRQGHHTVPAELRGTTLLFQGACPPRAFQEYQIYFSDAPPASAARPPAITWQQRNLLQNAAFEQGQTRPEHWDLNPGPGKETVFSLDAQPVPDGSRRALKMHVPATAARAWRGWRQSLPIEPGRTYLLAGWSKCQDLEDDAATLHIHFHAADKKLCQREAMQSLPPGVRGNSDWTLVSGLLTAPPDAASITILPSTQAKGTVWFGGLSLTAVQASKIVRLESRPLPDNAPLRLWPVNPIVKVFPDEPARPTTSAAIRLARNEREALQLAVRSPRAIADVQVEVEPPVAAHGAKLDDIEVNVVGYVPIDHPTSYYHIDVPEWQRKYPVQAGQCDGWAGLWPDPLLPGRTLNLAPNATQAVWLTFRAGKTAPAGDYRGRVRLVHQGQTLAETPLEVHVWNFELPDQCHVGALYEVRPSGPWWGDDRAAVTTELARFMAQRRVHAAKIEVPTGIKYQDGKVSADFSAFDRAAEFYFDELKIPYVFTPHDFYLFGWGMPPAAKFGQQPYAGTPPFAGVDRNELRPEFCAAYQACLKVFWDHVKARGWDRRFVLYISDEPFDRLPEITTQMQALCRMIHEVDPQIPIYSSTWHHVPAWNGALNVWGIGHYGVVTPERMAERRAAGDRIWFTTDGQMCTDTPTCGTERLLPHYCFHYGAEAYEFWGAAWLTYDPHRFGWHRFIHQSDQPGKSYWIRYPNGDGYLIYPGATIGRPGQISSIRLEQAGEGVEDYEYLYLLRQRIAAAKAAGQDVAAAEAVLADAARLVTIPNAGGRYSSKNLPDPDAVFRSRAAIAETIERLNR